MTAAVRRVTGMAGALLLLGVSAGPAGAHVSVSAPGASPGGFTKLVFRVPNEKPDQATTSFEVVLPEAQPFAGVSVRPQAGWKYEAVTEPLPTPLDVHGREVREVVRRVVWRAQGAGIKPGEFEEFEVSAGPLPQTRSLTFQALQTYSGGDVVRWIQDSAGADDEPERPAPVLELSAAGTSNEREDAPGAWEIAALGLGGLGLLTGVTALLTATRRRPSASRGGDA